MEPLSLASPSGDPSQPEYAMYPTTGYPSPYETPSSAPLPFDDGSMRGSFSTTKTGDFDAKDRLSVLMVSVVLIGLIALAAFIYLQALRTDDSGGEGVDVGIFGSKGIGGEPSAPASQGSLPKPEVVVRPTPMATPRSTTTPRPSGAEVVADFYNRALNRSVAPCQDFYTFVCGKFSGAGDAISKLSRRAEAGIKEALNTIDVPPRLQRASEKAAGLYRACVRLASNTSRTELEPVKEFLSHLRLDLSNIDPDPFYNIPHRLVYLSCVYGFPTFVKFDLFWDVTYGKLLGAWINKDDENWMNSQHKKNTRPQLLAFYRSYLHLYDPNIDSSALAERIVNLEVIVKDLIAAIWKGSWSITTLLLSKFGSLTKDYYQAEDWARLFAQATGDTYKATSHIRMWNNVTGILVLLLNKNQMSRDDARLIMSWSLVHRLLPLASGRLMAADALSAYRGRRDRIPHFCFRRVFNMMPLAAAHGWFNAG
ncbi:uncharacterized protein LOC144134490 [Amblyomma americanum]